MLRRAEAEPSFIQRLVSSMLMADGWPTSANTALSLDGTRKVYYTLEPAISVELLTLSDTPLKQEWSLSARPGHLRLLGGCYDLSSPESPTLLLRKQTKFTQVFDTILDFQPSKKGHEAGIVVWWSMYAYASIGISRSTDEPGPEKRTIVMRAPTSKVGTMSVSFPVHGTV